MASDIVRDLQLDQPQDDINSNHTRTKPERIDNIRAYLATQYLCSGFAANWQKAQTLPFHNWTATCCGILAGNEDDLSSKSDQTLAWLVRLQHLIVEIWHLNKRRGAGGRGEEQDEEQRIMLTSKGMEAQLREFQGQMPAEISCQCKKSLTCL